jgi:hypothetical protein
MIQERLTEWINLIRFVKKTNMKRVYPFAFLLIFALGNVGFLKAQCSPSPAVTNLYSPVGPLPVPAGGVLTPSNFYVYPGQVFDQVITAMPPQSTTVNNPLGFPPTITVNINWIRVTSIGNLPAWASYSCGGQLDPLDPCKMAFPTWSCVNAYANTANGQVPLNEIPGTIYNLDVILDVDVTVLGTQSNYNGGSINLYVLDSFSNTLTFDPCDGGSISASPNGGFNDPGAWAYTWNTGQTTQNITNVSNGWYTCTVLDQATGWTTTDSILVSNVYPSLSIQDLNVSQPTVSNDGSIAINVSGGTGPYTYAWTGPNGFTANTASINNLYGGAYVLTVTDANGCVETNSYFLSAVSLESLELNKKINVYPNPSKGNVSINGFQNYNGVTFIQVYDFAGKVLVERFIQNLENNLELNLSNLPSGKYTLSITQGKAFTFKELIIAN